MKYKIRYCEILEKYIEIDADDEDAAIKEAESIKENEPYFFEDLEMTDGYFEVVDD